jgi:hypothetical protein
MGEHESYVLSELKSFPLAKDSYIVVGSGILDALGIRRANDIDIVTPPDVFEELRRQGWEPTNHPDRESLNHGEFEAYLGWDNPGGQPNFDDLTASRTVIDGFNFVSLERVMKWKEEHARPKDLADIKLIKELLKHN